MLEKYGVELIGANLEAINKGEDRQIFKQLVLDAGADVARSHIAHTLEEAYAMADDLGYPLVIRPSFTMGGLGSGFAYNPVELERMVTDGLHQSPTTEVLLEESILGWKEYELELMRDTADNTVVVCSIENVDPVGVHTGDSITVAPALTLTDREYQNLRDIGIDIIRAVGVDTGGCNIQFAVAPRHRTRDRHRDEPAGLAVERARVEGHRLPDREDRGQARDRLPARRDPERHHPGRPRRASSRRSTTSW